MNSLWARLILHFWAREVDRALEDPAPVDQPDPTEYLQRAYEHTIRVTSTPHEWQGTTTACMAIIHADPRRGRAPVVYATNLGDSQVLVLRPAAQAVIYKTVEQWHWFDCPRQLGTNSPDTPRKNAVTDQVAVQEGDVVLAVSDGVTDNLWEHEVAQTVIESLRAWDAVQGGTDATASPAGRGGRMAFVAQRLVDAARTVAQDPFAESPFMERAVEEGLAIEGGEWSESHRPGS